MYKRHKIYTSIYIYIMCLFVRVRCEWRIRAEPCLNATKTKTQPLHTLMFELCVAHVSHTGDISAFRLFYEIVGMHNQLQRRKILSSSIVLVLLHGVSIKFYRKIDRFSKLVAKIFRCARAQKYVRVKLNWSIFSWRRPQKVEDFRSEFLFNAPTPWCYVTQRFHKISDSGGDSRYQQPNASVHTGVPRIQTPPHSSAIAGKLADFSCSNLVKEQKGGRRGMIRSSRGLTAVSFFPCPFRTAAYRPGGRSATRSTRRRILYERQATQAHVQ